MGTVRAFISFRGGGGEGEADSTVLPRTGGDRKTLAGMIQRSVSATPPRLGHHNALYTYIPPT